MRKTHWIIVIAGLIGVSQLGVFAQEKKVELTPFFGYTASGGLDVGATDIGGGVIVDRLTPKSAISYGGLFEYFLSENWAVGFNFSQQRSKLEGRIQGGGKQEFTDMPVNNYHAILSYHTGDEDSSLRPFFLFGLGATQYSPSDIGGQQVDGLTRFSPTFGGGVKYYASESIGFRFGARWTPTYFYSTPAGVWCSPFWPGGCWVLANDHDSHQGEFSGGVTFRF
jgi:hypothetical protein